MTAEPMTTAPVNVALAANGAVATASSAYDPAICGSGAVAANDGDRTGRARCSNRVWNDAAPANTFPDWLEIDFNGSKTITEIDVITIQDHLEWPVEPSEAMSFSLYGLTAYEVQYWNNSTWVTIPGGNVSGNNKVWRKFTFAAITTNKIRVWATASADGYSRIVELEAWTGPSPAPRYDLALGATATASTSYPGWGPSAVVNGDRKSLNAYSDGAWSSAAANNFPEWVEVNFGANKTINEIQIFTLQDNWAASTEPTQEMTFTLYGLSSYEVQYWTGSGWVTVPGGSVTDNNKIWKKFTFSLISTSKIRVLSHVSPDGVSRITEVEAYGPVDSAGNGIQWLVSDHLGTPRMILDETGTVANMTRHDYLPFGEELMSQGLRSSALGYANADGVRQQFTQKERDTETGLDYFIARYYSSIQGRFTSSDPGPLIPGDPQSFNRYAYVQNNPLKFIDPTGEILTIGGEDASYLVGELERLTGYKLKHDTKTGVVTIDDSQKRKTGKGISDNLAKELEGAIGLKNAKGEDVTLAIKTTKNDDKIFFDDFGSKTIDIADYKAFTAIEADNSAFAASQLGHVLNEYSKAETVYTGLKSQGSGDTSPWFIASHAQGLAAEGRVMSDFTGKPETAARTIISGLPLVGFEYTSVRYLVERQSQVVNGKKETLQTVANIRRRTKP